ncbi:MAG: hypothetical protein AB7I52_17430 [Rhizobiaceae bacterium]
MTRAIILAAAVAFSAPALAEPLPASMLAAPAAESTDSATLATIAASIARYKGKCPCPYTLKANGKPCGRSSAWSRPGGQPVICYPADVAGKAED